MTTFIYTRISTVEQNDAGQLNELIKKYGDDAVVVSDKFTGKTTARPKFQAMLEKMRGGDTLVVREVSRIGRKAAEVLAVTEQLQSQGIALIVDNLGIDVTSSAGKMVLTMMAGIAQMELELTAERQAIGIAQAKREGKYKGRKPTDIKIVNRAKELKNQGLKMPEIAKLLDTPTSTLYRVLRAA